MKIKNFIIKSRVVMYEQMSLFEQNKIKEKEFEFKNDTIIYNPKNSTGKTTFVRSLLYTLGFNIPNTEMVRFEKYDFFMLINIKNIDYELYRRGDYYRINDTEYMLPDDIYEIHSILFNTPSHEILNNILACFYIDQEKGWTLLNRGVIIGENRLNIESLFRALNDSDCYDLVEERKVINKEINKYNLILSISEYQKEINLDINNELVYTDIKETDFSRQASLELKLNEINNEIKKINNIMKKNNEFVRYIDRMNLRITYEGIEIPVKKENLLDFDDVYNLNEIRRNRLLENKNEILKEISKINQRKKEERKLVNVKTVIDSLEEEIKKVPIDNLLVTKIIKELKEERKKLDDEITKFTKKDNKWIEDFYKIIKEYLEEFDLPFPINEKIVFTKKLKGYSGAVLHKLVFAFKLGYLRLVSKKTGLKLPFIIDSPSGREVEEKNIDLMLSVLKRDFKGHQIIVSSIHKYEKIFDEAKIIEMDGKTFDF